MENPSHLEEPPINDNNGLFAENPLASPCNQELLNRAWVRQRVYSDNAAKAQSRFLAVRLWRIMLNLLVIFLAIFHAEAQRVTAQLNQYLTQGNWQGSRYAWLLDFQASDAEQFIHGDLWQFMMAAAGFLLILLPILISALLAFSTKFDRGMNWLLLRGNAEALKMEIFLYRTCIGEYRQNRDLVLARKLKTFSERIKGSPVHLAAFNPYEGLSEVVSSTLRAGLIGRILGFLKTQLTQRMTLIWTFLWGAETEEKKPLFQLPQKETVWDLEDENLKYFSDLTAEEYVGIRLNEQFDWYRRKSQMLNRQLQIHQTCIYIFGGVGTLLAAVGLQSWVALATTVIGSFTNYLEFKRIEATLVGYNQAADTLYDIRAWWSSLTPIEQAKPHNVFLLVKSTEDTIRSEHLSWLQDMQDKLAQLYSQDGKEDRRESTSEAEPLPADASGIPVSP